MTESIDEQFLRRAIRLAMTARGRVEPNPMVGCVLVKNGRVIGEGCHSYFGGPHAEPTALAACTESPAGATAYVTLEPCCHLNKKTPPCAPKLIEAKIARVVVGCLDPNPDVDGKGLAMLRAAGIEVVGPVLEDVAKQLLAPFIARTLHERPYVTMKWAETADGKVAGPGGARLAISNAPATRCVHELRSRCDAILVGVDTVRADDPLLTARDVPNARPLQRMVLDSSLRTPIESKLVQSAGDGSVEIFLTAAGFVADRVKPMLAAGVNLVVAEADEDARINLPKLLQRPSFADVSHLLVEPGPTLARSFFDAGAADRLWVIRSTKRVDDAAAPVAAKIPARYLQAAQWDVEGDTITEYLDRESDVFFAADPSADAWLAGFLP